MAGWLGSDNPYDLVGQTLHGKWHVDSVIGVGGMATVFAATHRNGLKVAIKKLHSIYATRKQIKQRFLNEGYAANKVGHPGALMVLDDDELEDGTVFIVMELLEGQPLDQRLKRKQTLDYREVLYIADQVLDVLAAAHSRGIIHRDIKPPNLFLKNDGTVKVLDFGLAKIRERPKDNKWDTKSGMVIGTASYMPPEQARGKKELITERTDLWAVGATMFKALTGEYVHAGDTVDQRLVAAMTLHGRRLEDVAPGLPRSVHGVVNRAIEFQPSDRYASAAEMQEQVRRAFREETGRPMPLPAEASVEAGWTVPTDTEGPDSIDWEDEASGRLTISVVFDSESNRDSVVVDLESEQHGTKRFELRRMEELSETVVEGEEPLSEVTAVEVPHGKT